MENYTNYDSIKEQILKHIDPEFKQPEDFTIPFEFSVVIKKIDMGPIQTDTGIILGAGKASNRVFPHVGVIVAAGPKAPDYLVPGLRVYFSQNEDLEFWIGSGFYHMMHYTSVYSTVPASAFVTMDTKDDRELAREKGIEREEGYQERVKLFEDNEMDKNQELIKKIKNGGYKA